jgi:hypothetical protein
VSRASRIAVATRTEVSPGGAIAIGVFMGAIGTFVVLTALGVFGEGRLSDGTPTWVGVAAGLAFVAGGLAMIVGYGIAGGVAPDGGLPPGTPLAVYIVQSAVGITIATMLALIASWVAFGPGVRHFRGTGLIFGDAVNEAIGRTVFGVGAVLVWLFVAALLVMSIKQVGRRSRPM